MIKILNYLSTGTRRMSYEIHYHDESDFLRVTLSGIWTAPNAETALKSIREEADNRGFTRLLFDGRKLPQSPGEMTRFHTGESLAKYLPPPYSVAIWRNPEQIDRFLENVALNRGARVAVLACKDEAVRWLMGG